MDSWSYKRCFKLSFLRLIITGMLLFTPLDAQLHNVLKVGNKVQSTVRSSETGGIVFLLNDIKLPTGVVFAFEAYYTKTQPVRFQVWRPIPPPPGLGGNNTQGNFFVLVGEMKVMSTVEKDTSVAYIASRVSDKCIVAQENDRLGIYEEGTEGAVGFEFDDLHIDVLSYKLQNDSIPAGLGDTVQFSTLTFPYVFSFATYIDTAMINYPDYVPGINFVTCTPNLNINNLAPATTLPPATGEPGATGPQGATGPFGPVGPRGEQGHTGPQGGVGSIGPFGEMGATGMAGVLGIIGATGPMGKFGKTGPRGDMGATGSRGPPGPAGPQGKAVSKASTEGGDFFSNPVTVLILLIWLAIVTILLILILIIVITMHRRRREKAREIERNNASFTSGMMPGAIGLGPHDSSQDWMGTMKEDSEAGYANDTIIIDGKRKSRRQHALNNNMSASTPLSNSTTTNLNGRSKSTSSETPEMTSTLRSPGYEQPPDIMASSQPPVSPIPPPLTPPTSPGPISPKTPGGTNDFPFENEISSTTDTITRTYDNQGNLSQDNLHMIGN